MKTLFAALASATILAAPLAASAQPGQWDHHGGGGWQGRGGQGAQAPAAPAPQPQAQNPAPSFGGGQHGGWQGRGGNGNRGFNNGGQAQTPQYQAPQRQFGGGQNGGQRNFGDRQQGFAGRDAGRDFNRGGDRGGYNRGGDFDRRGYADRGGWRGGNVYRGHYRAWDPRYARDFRWAVGAYLPRTYWTAAIDPYAYGLDAAPWGYHWVIVDGEALLIQDYTGAIVQAFLL